MNILLLYLKSRSYGLGHYKRVVNYKLFFKQNGFKVTITNINSFVKNKKKLNNFNYIFLDISNYKYFKIKKFRDKINFFFQNKNQEIFIIDGLGKDLFTKTKLMFSPKKVIIPYFVDKSFKRNPKYKYLFGPEYLLNKPKYKHVKKNKKNIKNILISAGGSDLGKNCYKIVNLIHHLEIKNLQISIIKGNFFLIKDIKKIKNFCRDNNLKLKFLNFKKNIYQNIGNQDLIISSSGLTKYDLIYCKMPFILFCENNIQYLHNKGFEKKKLCPVLKKLNKKNQFKNIQILKKFIFNSNIREKYLNRICKLVDSDINLNPKII